jgi:hypothetical protein
VDQKRRRVDPNQLELSVPVVNRTLQPENDGVHERRLGEGSSGRAQSYGFTGVLIVLGIVFVVGFAAILIADINKVPTDPIERILTPAITGLIGVLSGLFHAKNHDDNVRS